MGIVNDNLRFLRKRLRYTQGEMAEKIGIKRSLIGAYEEGRADPRINNLINFSREFSISVDHLISTDLTQLSDEQLESLSADAAQSGDSSAGMKVLAVTVDPQDNEMIDLVPQKAAAGYTNGYADPEFLEDLPKFRLPNLPGGNTYRAFEISGDSMLPIQPGSIIIGQYTERISDIKNGSTYILVTAREGVVYKRVFNYTEERGALYLVSDNRQYSAYEVPVEEVSEVWEAKAYISSSFPDESSAPSLSLEKLTEMVMELQQEVIRLKSK